MTNTPPIGIANEEAFLVALEINPNEVVKGSLRMGFDDNSTPFVTYAVIRPIMPHMMGLAFLASAQEMGAAAPEQPTEQAPAPDQGQATRTGASARTAKKTPAKKAASKKP